MASKNDLEIKANVEFLLQQLHITSKRIIEEIECNPIFTKPTISKTQEKRSIKNFKPTKNKKDEDKTYPFNDFCHNLAFFNSARKR